MTDRSGQLPEWIRRGLEQQANADQGDGDTFTAPNYPISIDDGGQLAPNVGELMTAVRDAWTLDLEIKHDRGASAPRHHVYASARRECERRQCLDLTHPENTTIDDPDAFERFQRGNEREDAIYARLIRVGQLCRYPFTVIGGQEGFQLWYDPDTKAVTWRKESSNARLLMAGKIDARLDFGQLWPGGPKVRPVCEIKSMQSMAKAKTVADLRANPWSWSKPDQLLAYLLAKGETFGLFINDTMAGRPNFIPVELAPHLEDCDAFIQQALRAHLVSHNEAELPAYTDRFELCQRCPHYFAGTCLPPAIDITNTEVEVIPSDWLLDRVEAWAASTTKDKTAKRAWDGVRATLFSEPPNQPDPPAKGTKSGDRPTRVRIVGDYKITAKMTSAGAWRMTITKTDGTTPWEDDK